MKLKKINENLQKALSENGLIDPNEMQLETFSTIKSGADMSYNLTLEPEKQLL